MCGLNGRQVHGKCCSKPGRITEEVEDLWRNNFLHVVRLVNAWPAMAAAGGNEQTMLHMCGVYIARANQRGQRLARWARCDRVSYARSAKSSLHWSCADPTLDYPSAISYTLVLRQGTLSCPRGFAIDQIRVKRWYGRCEVNGDCSSYLKSSPRQKMATCALHGPKAR